MEVEFIENTDEHGKPRSSDDEFKKQDCELKAFYRLAASLKEHYPRLPICLLLDGLYCNQNVLSICEKNQWDGTGTRIRHHRKLYAKLFFAAVDRSYSRTTDASLKHVQKIAGGELKS